MIEQKELVFIRHALPRGKILDKKKGPKFLGIKENHSIIIPSKEKVNYFRALFKDFDLFICSPIKRCEETIKLISNGKIIKNNLLEEIDYGQVDGLFLEDAKRMYPDLFSKWEKGIDERFPGGENNLDVIKRAKKFITFLEESEPRKILICTHNVFLRCLIGSNLKIPVQKWHKIFIPYFEPLKFVLRGNKLFFLSNPLQKREIFKNFFQGESTSFKSSP